MPYRTTIVLVANAIAWAMLLHAPWGQIVGPAPVALVAIHLGYPVLAPSGLLPVLVGLVDAVALYAAYHHHVWGDLTIVIVSVLAGGCVVALGYASAVVLLVQRYRAKRQPPA